jgi:plasmid stabilization system protein ParE
MAGLDRDELIDLLERLGSPEEAQALEAARLLDRRVREAGTSWAELLAPTGDAAAAPPDAEAKAEAEPASDLALIDHLLSAYELTPQTRQDLEDMKADIAAGEFTDRDARYLRDLRARLDRTATGSGHPIA